MKSSSESTVTIEDVARRVGVSRSTVSIVLRGQEKERKISAETTQRVRTAMRELNYVPNGLARNLRLQRSGMIGVVISNLRADWAQSLMDGMMEAFRPSGYTPFVAIHRFDAELAHQEFLACLRRRDEGIICQPMPGEQELFTSIQNSGVPLIFLGDRPEDMPNVSFVGWDSSAAARLAVEHLVEIGRKRIAFIGVDYPMEMTRGRFAAYRDVLAESSLAYNEDWVANAPIDWHVDQILDWSLNKFFAPGGQHPDAIFALNDGIALILLEALDARGIRVPEDVAVIGMGDLPMTGHRGIGLSTVREPITVMGREAAELMIKMIAQPTMKPVQHLIPGQEIKVRRTTVPPEQSD